jgi:hypothetical protein
MGKHVWHKVRGREQNIRINKKISVKIKEKQKIKL